MAVLCLPTMTDTLAARVTHGARKYAYKHTVGASMIVNEAVPTECPRLRLQMNIHWPSKASRGTLIEFVSSVHMSASSGTVNRVQMARELCVVKGPSGPGGFE